MIISGLSASDLRLIGEFLEERDYEKAEPVAFPFEGDESDRKEKLASAFLSRWGGPIAEVICDEGRVKASIQVAGGSTAIATDLALAGVGIPVPVGGLGSILCQIGLDKFCKGAAPNSQIS